MSSEFSFLSKDDDQRWWLIGFLIVAVLFVAMLVSVTLGGEAHPEMNALAGVLIALFVGCGAFLGALFVDRAGTAIGVFDETAEILQNPKELEAKRQLLAASTDLDRQIDFYLRRVQREFAPEAIIDPAAIRSAPVGRAERPAPGSRVESNEPIGVMPPPPPMPPRQATVNTSAQVSHTNSASQANAPKSLAEWTPPQSDATPPPVDPNSNRRRQRRDWVA